MLREIENNHRSKFSEDVVIKSALTVEHVMPQSWEENWPLQNGEKITSQQKFQAALNENISLEILGLAENKSPTIYDRINYRNKLLHTFGNLTLLTQALNSSVSKSSFQKRRGPILEQSALALNRYFQNIDSWDEDKILERGKSLFLIAKDIWPYPSKNN